MKIVTVGVFSGAILGVLLTWMQELFHIPLARILLDVSYLPKLSHMQYAWVEWPLHLFTSIVLTCVYAFAWIHLPVARYPVASGITFGFATSLIYFILVPKVTPSLTEHPLVYFLWLVPHLVYGVVMGLTIVPKFKNAVVLFDGVCILCSGAVKFIIENDPSCIFRFAPIQSAYADKLRESGRIPVQDVDSIVLIETNRVHTASSAVLLIARQLTGVSPVVAIFLIVPPSIRDRCYRYVAARRYSWFGRKETCLIPTPDVQFRFFSD